MRGLSSRVDDFGEISSIALEAKCSFGMRCVLSGSETVKATRASPLTPLFEQKFTLDLKRKMRLLQV